MTDNATTEVAAIGVRLLDDAYLAWFSAESECELALHAWFQRTDGARRGRVLRLPPGTRPRRGGRA